MRLRFFKMQGCGNDFLFLDCIQSESIAFRKEEVQFYCDRNFGIGADGLVVLKSDSECDFAWDFYNSDGSSAQMCGNAARCAILFYSQKENLQSVCSFKTLAGVIKGKVLGPEKIEISMLGKKDPTQEYESRIIEVNEEPIQLYCIDTGVPHAVIEVKDIFTYPIAKIGKLIQQHALFTQNGTNVTFFQRKVANHIYSTTFERGVGAETLACGTGAIASALVFSELYYETLPITVEVPGGILEVDTSPVSKVILLNGPAEFVFEVDIESTQTIFEKRFVYEQKRAAMRQLK